MKKLILIGVLLSTLFLTGCMDETTPPPPSNEKETVLVIEKGVGESTTYLEGLGYDVLNYENTSTHTITQENFKEYENSDKWAIQNFNINNYLNKEIEEHTFIGKNHPLDNLSTNESKLTKLSVFVCDNKVIGGYSTPNTNASSQIFSINGKAAEQVLNEKHKVASKTN